MKRLIIVGGVAAGASAAAKARRMSEEIEIILFEAGPYISFANCGLPYYLGGEIVERSKLVVTTESAFAQRFQVDVRTRTPVESVDAVARRVTFRGPDGEVDSLSYDRLILATGTEAMVPPIQGIDSKRVFPVRTIPDVDRISAVMAERGVRRTVCGSGKGCHVLVIGAGYIGIETAEQLGRLGMSVTIVELADQVMPVLDPEIARPAQLALEETGIRVILDDGLETLAPEGADLVATTSSGETIRVDFAILAAGVRPNVRLAVSAGLTLGASGAIQVDRFQRTSDPSIYAAGDNSETMHRVLGRPVNIPLAGPANKAGRIAGANAALDLLARPDSDPGRLSFKGTLGTAVVRAGDTFVAMTGLTEKQAISEGINHQVTYVAGSNHAGYYPGAKPILLKLLTEPSSGKVIGAQAVGGEGVEKRVDVFATAIQGGFTIEDIEDLDLCYAPPVGSARDVAIQAGFYGSNCKRSVSPSITPAEFLALREAREVFTIDVRTAKEFSDEHLDGAVNIDVDLLRERLAQVPSDRPIYLYCQGGYRSYLAQRILLNSGWSEVYNIQGGFGLISQFLPLGRARAKEFQLS
ncbi:MAG: FAD-dependent oxidoreductase [Acidobacteriota bacterium]|nr:MAG: FAD-dependent oxidoreductase [Acidobacteriota bacterium]